MVCHFVMEGNGPYSPSVAYFPSRSASIRAPGSVSSLDRLLRIAFFLMNNPAKLPSWSRPLAIVTAVVFLISWAFPVAGGLTKNTAAFSKWWGILDVGLAFVLVILAFVIISLTHSKVDKQVEDTTYRAYRVLIHAILAMIVIFFLFGNHITWINCITGFGWRAWLLLYGLPAWLTAVKSPIA